METELNAHEARVLGVLIEKAFTTPDQYPLSLNAATNGSNQKSNRNPVVDFAEAEVVVAFQGLQMKHLAGSTFPAGSRVEKWHHSAKEHLSLNDAELAVLAELMLRGPQAQGELRTRASRMRTIANLEELGQVLARLIDKGYVRRLAPGPGSRAERYAQTLAAGLHPDGEAVPQAAPASVAAAAGPAVSAPRPARPATPLEGRVDELERQVTRLRTQLADLAEKLGEPLTSEPD